MMRSIYVYNNKLNINKNMKIWLTTDTHFNHHKMVELCGRPANFEEKIVSGLLQIPSEDILIHLGDICIGNDGIIHQEYIKPLRCKKWLIRGNHDKKSNGWYLSKGWDFVGKLLIDKYFGKNILFSHEPVQEFSASLDYNIHGHLHDNLHRTDEAITDKKHLLLSLEIYGYAPVTLDSFLHKTKISCF